MNDQRQHTAHQEEGLRHSGDDPDAAERAERLAGERDQLEAIFASAEAILARLRQDDAERVLEQMRQSGGE